MKRELLLRTEPTQTGQLVEVAVFGSAEKVRGAILQYSKVVNVDELLANRDGKSSGVIIGMVDPFTLGEPIYLVKEPRGGKIAAYFGHELRVIGQI